MYIDHVGINTNDMEATLQFYCGILGMRLVRTTRTPDGRRHYNVEIGGGNAFAVFDGAELPTAAFLSGQARPTRPLRLCQSLSRTIPPPSRMEAKLRPMIATLAGLAALMTVSAQAAPIPPAKAIPVQLGAGPLFGSRLAGSDCLRFPPRAAHTDAIVAADLDGLDAAYNICIRTAGGLGR